MFSNDGLYILSDTHCHILHMIDKTNIEAFSADEIQEIRKIIHLASLRNVHHIFEVGTTRVDSTLALELAKQFKNVFPVVGIHPHEARHRNPEDLDTIRKLLEYHHDLIVGVGECGLDKHYPDHDLEAQIDLFTAQIELALKYDKALVVHTRDAEDETYAVLERYKNDLKRVTIHCFSNSSAFAQQVAAWGWFLGIGGTVTYPKNNVLREAVKTVGLSSIVLETDAPFLPPQSIRGKQNSPEQIFTIAEYIADLLQTDIAEVAKITTGNAEKLFKLGQ